MKVDTWILTILDKATVEGNALRLPEQLARADYLAVAKVLEAGGAKWDRKFGAHLFAGDAADAVDPILLTGEVTDAKREFGFFETPAPVVRRLVELADVRPHHRVLEPSAGRGAIARAVEPLCHVLQCFEVDPANCKVLKAAVGRGTGIWCGDFFHAMPKPIYDRVIMNPPFSRQLDIKHVMHAVGFLAPLGRLVSVMSAGVVFRGNGHASAFRSYLGRHNATIEPVPPRSFAASGTNVNAILVRLDVP